MENKPTWPDVLVTGVAPAIWGSSYYVTSEFLPQGYPLTLAVLRALPAGLLLLLIIRRLPPLNWWGRIFILGGLNFAAFWSLMFVAAYTLPGGVAATLVGIQAITVIFLARLVLGAPVVALALVSALGGLGGVALLVLTPSSSLDPIGVAAGVGGAIAMAAGTVMTRKWHPPVSPLTFTAWQLTAGGILLVPVAVWFEPPLPALTTVNVMGLVYLGGIGAALTYFLWFRGVARIEPSAVSTLGFLSPVTAVILGWALLGQTLTPLQGLGTFVILASIWTSQHAMRPARRTP